MGFPILNDEQVARLDVVDSAVCAPKQVVIVRGEILNAVFLINRGAAAAEYRRGQKKFLVKLEAGDFFGEESLRDLPSSRTVRAVEVGTIVLAITAQSFLRLLDADPELNQLYVQAKTEHLAMLDRMILETATLPDVRRERPINAAPHCPPKPA